MKGRDITLNPLRWFACIFLRIPVVLLHWGIRDYLVPGLEKLADWLPTLDAPTKDLAAKLGGSNE